MKYIIFDMDGVLVNTEPEHYKVWEEVLSEYGLPHIDYEKYKPCIGATLRAALDLIYDVYGLDLRKDETVLPKFRQKNEAERKLREVEENMIRIGDILAEL